MRRLELPWLIVSPLAAGRLWCSTKWTGQAPQSSAVAKSNPVSWWLATSPVPLLVVPSLPPPLLPPSHFLPLLHLLPLRLRVRLDTQPSGTALFLCNPV